MVFLPTLELDKFNKKYIWGEKIYRIPLYDYLILCGQPQHVYSYTVGKFTLYVQYQAKRLVAILEGPGRRLEQGEQKFRETSVAP